MAGSVTPAALSTSEIEQLIRDAGREPIERDTLYNIVRVPALPVG
jgi:aminodeoxyfutalosine synthase